ncbi:MAG TPA: hypothetical protein VFB41_07665, partial [Solirubrobacteraceae bacterium]|nr:hypothetical protein [Solirubrobacteraceae bacterium]
MGELDDWVDARSEQLEQRLRQLGTRNPRCGCGEADPAALCGTAPDISCYECLQREQGRSAVEDHHLKARANDPADTVSVLGNDHRWLSEAQRLWPIDTLRNPDGSPLLRAAAALRGWLDVLRLILDRTVGWVPAFLEWLDAALR